MNLFGAIAFGQPLLLAGLLLLPVIWWLLRLTPPRPLRMVFPPVRLILGLENREETPATSPWWLTALRVLICALVILALAAPILRPDQRAISATAGPLVLFVDNGWAAAQDWDRRIDSMNREIERARANGETVMLVPTAVARLVGTEPPRAAERVAETVSGVAPLPFAPDRIEAFDRFRAALPDNSAPRFVWLSDGIDYGDAAEFAERLAAQPGGGTPIEAYTPDGSQSPIILGVPKHDGTGLSVQVRRARSGTALQARVRALAFNGRYLGEGEVSIPAAGTEAEARIDLPLELVNEVARVEIAGVRSAAAVRLLDDRWRLPRIGLITGEFRDISQPLLSPLYYVERALAPYAELVEKTGRNLPETVSDLIAANVGTIVMTDIGRITGEPRDQLEKWIDRGGVLVRFAGPRLASGPDDLVPVRLRQGGRSLGGTLSWHTPRTLGAFGPSGPFAGLAAPDEVTISRQVLAEPDAGLTERTWAQLDDGTPLVTGARRGKGQVVLFHVTANPSWSSLPLSGLFVDMLRRIAEMAPASLAEADARAADDPQAAIGELSLRPYRTLDGFGVLSTPPSNALPLSLSGLGNAVADRGHPPGYYGPAESPRAVNTLAGNATLTPIADLPAQFVERSYLQDEPLPLKPWLLLAALLLLAADGIAILFLSGQRLRMRPAGAAVLLVALLAAVPRSDAQEASADEFALKAVLQTRLAYVLSGESEIDEAARQGLAGLGREIARRTALEPGEPLGIDVTRDELAFFPLIYWPVDPQAPDPDPATLARIDAYMKQGGTILFDTRDQASAATGTGPVQGGPGMRALQRLLARIDVPALEPVPADHVLTKAFYLLQAFPGRWDGGALWVEATPEGEEPEQRPVRQSDGVSSILVTSNDLAAAWAMDDGGRPLYPVVPGGERQREMALRTGINIVMYSLTGNYKADQVHVPALLERLGQ